MLTERVRFHILTLSCLDRSHQRLRETGRGSTPNGKNLIQGVTNGSVSHATARDMVAFRSAMPSTTPIVWPTFGHMESQTRIFTTFVGTFVVSILNIWKLQQRGNHTIEALRPTTALEATNSQQRTRRSTLGVNGSAEHACGKRNEDTWTRTASESMHASGSEDSMLSMRPRRVFSAALLSRPYAQPNATAQSAARPRPTIASNTPSAGASRHLRRLRSHG